METNGFVIKFADATEDVGNSYAQELKQELKEADPTAQIEQKRTRINAQDFGASLVLILGTGAVTAIARGLSSWVARNSGAKIVIETPDGKVLVDHLDSKDAQQVVASVFSKKKA